SGVLTRSSAHIAVQASLTARVRTNPKRTKSPCSTEISRFSSTLSVRKQPLSLRSSVTNARPCEIADCGESTFTSRSPIESRPEREGRGSPAADVAAVAQHGQLVGDLEQLLQPMGDVEDAFALGLELANDREQVVRVPLAERRGGLVHDEQLRLIGERSRDLD